MASSKLLLAAKSLSVDPAAANAKNLLAAAARYHITQVGNHFPGLRLDFYGGVFPSFLCFRAVTDSINQLITLCTQQAPGQKECDNALRELEVNWPDRLVICSYFALESNDGVPALSLSLSFSSFQAVRGMLDNPNEPVSDLSYFDCIESVMENSKVGPSGTRP